MISQGDDAPTWENIAESASVLFGHKYTRQTLSRHPQIQEAYKLKKITANTIQATRNIDKKSPDALLDRIFRLENENETLKKENAKLLEQFAVWCHNATLAGISPIQLNRQLPYQDREISRHLKPTRRNTK